MKQLKDAVEKYVEMKNVSGYDTRLTGVRKHFEDGAIWALSKNENHIKELLKHLTYIIEAWEDVRISGRKDIMDEFVDNAKKYLNK